MLLLHWRGGVATLCTLLYDHGLYVVMWWRPFTHPLHVLWHAVYPTAGTHRGVSAMPMPSQGLDQPRHTVPNFPYTALAFLGPQLHTVPRGMLNRKEHSISRKLR